MLIFESGLMLFRMPLGGRHDVSGKYGLNAKTYDRTGMHAAVYYLHRDAIWRSSTRSEEGRTGYFSNPAEAKAALAKVAPYCIAITNPHVLARYGWKPPFPSYVIATPQLWEFWLNHQ